MFKFVLSMIFVTLASTPLRKTAKINHEKANRMTDFLIFFLDVDYRLLNLTTTLHMFVHVVHNGFQLFGSIMVGKEAVWKQRRIGVYALVI